MNEKLRIFFFCSVYRHSDIPSQNHDDIDNNNNRRHDATIAGPNDAASTAKIAATVVTAKAATATIATKSAATAVVAG